MNHLIALVAFTIFHGSFSVPIQWTKPIIYEQDKGYYKRIFKLHLFMNSETFILTYNTIPKGQIILYYNKILNNGTITTSKPFTVNSTGIYFFGMDSEITDDRKHVVMAFTSRIRNESRSPIDICFTESFDEGKTWSPYLKMQRKDIDNIDRRYPSITIEKATGTMAISYARTKKKNYEHIVSIRNPGTNIFNEMYSVEMKQYPDDNCVKLTYDKKNSKRYIHVFKRSSIGGNYANLHYARSDDEGKTWSKSIVAHGIGLNRQMPIVLVNESIAEGVIYIEYIDGNRLYFAFTKNHGQTWEEPIEVGENSFLNYVSALCGKKGKGRIFLTASKGRAEIITYFDINDHKLKVTDYPFKTMFMMGPKAMDCTHDERLGKYTLALMVSDEFSSMAYFSKGIMFDKR